MTKEMAINILRGAVLGTNEQTHEAVFMAIRTLKEQERVDAVEVVRCKDCVNCSECITDDGMYIYIRCLRNGATICENDFCSWGERREDAETD